MATPAGKHKRPKLKRYKKPKPIAPPKPHRPKRGDLRKIFRDYISHDASQRINALARAMSWYDTVQVYIGYKQKGKLTTTQLRHKNKAENYRLLGIKVSNSRKKEERYVTAVAEYELMAKVYKPPRFRMYNRKLKKNQKTFSSRHERMKDKYGKFLKMFEVAMAPTSVSGSSIKLKIDKLSSPYWIGSDGNVTFDRKLIASQKKLGRKKGLLSVLINLLPVLSDASSRIPEMDDRGHPTGRITSNYQLRYLAVLTMLNKFNQFCQQSDAPKTIVHRNKSTGV